MHWSYTEIMDMDIQERREYLRLLSEQIERENQAVDQASRRRSM